MGQKYSGNRAESTCRGGNEAAAAATALRRRILLAGTALATTLIGSVVTMDRAEAQQAVSIPFTIFSQTVNNTNNCIFVGSCAVINTFFPGASINLTNSGNFATFGFGAAGILTTTNLGGSITINNSGDLATAGAGAAGMFANTLLGGAIDITNTGDIATLGVGSLGITATTVFRSSDVSIDNRGNIATAAAGAIGINAGTAGRNSDISIVSSGNIATRGAYAVGIAGATLGRRSDVEITNSGSVSTRALGAVGIAAATTGRNSDVSIVSSGDIATRGGYAFGIAGVTLGRRSDLEITNNSSVSTRAFGAVGIYGLTFRGGSDIDATNSGTVNTRGGAAIGMGLVTAGGGSSITAENDGTITTRGGYASGIAAFTGGPNASVSITNTGDMSTRGFLAYGIAGATYGPASRLTIRNEGTVTTRGALGDSIFGATAGPNSDIGITNTGELETHAGNAEGIFVATYGPSSSVMVDNKGKIFTTGGFAEGINAVTVGRNSDVTVTNSGDVLTRGRSSDGIYAYTSGIGSQINIENTGSVRAHGRTAFGVYTVSTGPASPVRIANSGEVYGSTIGIYSYSASSTTINNSGDLSAGSGLAIDTVGARSFVNNSGRITGFVDLTRSSDIFKNMAGGEFVATNTSTFRGGSDLFVNEAGATLRTATKPMRSEQTRFIQLEQFNNRGLITMVDGQLGDNFKISNTPGGTDLRFDGAGASTLAVDTFLGGPGSRSDTFTVEGSTSGRTLLTVNNVNPGSGRLNRQGIPVVFVDGNVRASNFFLEKPIESGFFEYDLVFVPTGSGRFDLRSHAGGGAHVLPHVVTATHEVFHSSLETWFDQSADLRVLLARGSVCDDIAHPEERIRCQELYDATPAAWARGAGSWFNFDDSGATKANGKTYRYDLSRDLSIWQIESGFDFGKEGVLSQDDILVFGVLGGAVESVLEFDALARTYELSNLEVGAYASYLRGGFFLDTLFKAFFGELEPQGAVEFPETLDTQTYGLRVDSGYRFGGVADGPFVEPLATLAVSWTHIDDFTRHGNGVDFADDEEIRGRLGLRAGTSMQIWEGTTFEPFVVGSLWGLLSDEHSADLTSTGTTFSFTDKPDDVWGEVSGGVNFFNPEAQTAIFAKVDYRFAEDAEGVGAKGGMRVTW